MHLICPPKFCVTFVFLFSWILQPSQEKLKKMLMRTYLGQTRCISEDVQVANGAYAWLRHTSQFYHQASFVSKILRICNLSCASVFSLFNSTSLGIHLCKTSQLNIFNTRRGNEIFRFGVSMYKSHWCNVSCSSCFFFYCLALSQVVYTHPVGYSFTYRRCSDGCQNVLRGLG